MLLAAVACLGIAGWRMYGRTSFERTERASGAVGTLEEAPGGGSTAAGSSGGARQTGTGRSHMDEATGDATPPPAGDDGLVAPGFLLAAALLLVGAILARRWQGAKKDG